MKKNALDPRTDLLIKLIDQAYDTRAWHGTNLRGSIRGMNSKQSIWRPAPNRHNIWEITVHAAYWKYAIWRKLTGSKKGMFPLKGSNWFELPTPSNDKNWKETVELLKTYHTLLRKAIIDFDPEMLTIIPPGSKLRYEQYIYGVASHDLYHAGQIQLLKRLMKKR
jgi:hypothetical protein